MIKKLVVAGLVFLAILVVAVSYILVERPQFEVSITAEQIQKNLEKQFPYEKTQLFIFKTVLSNPEVRLDPKEEKIGLGSDITVFVSGVEALKTRIHMETGIRYESVSRSLFLADPALTQFELPGMKGKTQRVVRDIVGQAITEIIAAHPIYKLDGKNRAAKIAGAVLKDIKIQDGVMKVVFGF
ncbi:MAG: DUF1439 domain-containing protein [Thermodesulfobacteriota bacterium]